MRGRLLIVDDDQDLSELLRLTMAEEGFDVAVAHTVERAIDVACEGDFEAVVTDLRLGHQGSGLDVCSALAERRPEVPVILMTGYGDMDTVVSALRKGAYDFVGKPLEASQLAIVADRAVRHHRLTTEVERLRSVLAPDEVPSGIVGRSAPMKKLHELIGRVADSDASVLVAGESGTGKELVARALHDQSGRADRPFVAINCAAVPAQLLESELFGHVKGAFTDARSDRAGLFQKADGGTLFLDEIGEMELDVQAKLLRALQNRKVRPVGADEEVDFDSRVIAATNRSLETAIESGDFREDLYYRIAVVTIDVPPLRKRGSDILQLAQHFLERHARAADRRVTSISRPAADKLIGYDWPGNVRELENCMERAVLLAKFSDVRVDDLPPRIQEHEDRRVANLGVDPDDYASLATIERRYITEVLAATGGNKTEAARILEIDRSTLYRKLDQYEDEDDVADAG